MNDTITKKQDGVIIHLSTDHWEHLVEECRAVINAMCSQGATLYDVSQRLHIQTLFITMPEVLKRLNNDDSIYLSQKRD